MSLRQSPAAFFLLGLTALIVAGCGRAGPLEAPPQRGTAQSTDASKAAAERVSVSSSGQDPSDFDTGTEDGMMPSPLPTPKQSQPKRGLTIPNRPFLLDPLL